MSKHYIYKMEILENAHYCGSYIGQHKIGKKSPECDGYKGSGSMWKKYILSNHIPVKKTIIRVCDDIAETNYWEMFYIEQALQEGEYLWNIFKGGGGFEWGEKLSEEELRRRNKERFQKWYADNQTHICRLCLYEGKTMTFRALILRLRRKNISNPTETAKQYLI